MISKEFRFYLQLFYIIFRIMQSREWGMGNGEWGMGNGEWGMGNGEWGMGTGEWGLGKKSAH